MRLPRLGSVLAGCLSLLAAGGALAQSGELTAEERRALIEGELVRRPTTSREGRNSYIGGSSFQRVAAPRDQVFEQLLDVSAYPHLVPSLVEARVVEDRGERRVVFMRHQYLFVSASYHAIVTVDRDTHTVHFELDQTRPHDVVDGRGFISVSRYHDTESMVTWAVRADVGQGLLTGVFAPVIHDWILKVPFCVRGFVGGRVVC